MPFLSAGDFAEGFRPKGDPRESAAAIYAASGESE